MPSPALQRPTQGRIVYVYQEVVDSEGANPKENRPLLILTPTAEIVPDQPIYTVAISARLDLCRANEMVELPWAPFGKLVATRLSKRSAAICKWVLRIRHEDIRDYGGFVSAKKLNEILKKVREFGVTPTIEELPSEPKAEQRPPDQSSPS